MRPESESGRGGCVPSLRVAGGMRPSLRVAGGGVAESESGRGVRPRLSVAGEVRPGLGGGAGAGCVLGGSATRGTCIWYMGAEIIIVDKQHKALQKT